MKKIIGFLSLVAVVSIAACSDRTTEVKKEPTPVVVVKDPVEKPTVIVVDKNGAKVVTKKVDVSIKKQ